MSVFRDFQNVGIYRKTLKNWLSVVNHLRKNRRSINSLNFSITLDFRDGSSINVTHPRSIPVAIGYYKVSKDIGSHSQNDLIELLRLTENLSRKVEKVFKEDEFKLVFNAKEGMSFALIRKFKPKILVETGVAYGISSSAILLALKMNREGKLISIDLPNKNPSGYEYRDGFVDPVFIPDQKDAGWLVPSELRNRWSLKLGKSSDILPSLNTTLDMFFHDSEHSYENMMSEFMWANQHMESGGIIGADDFHWNDAFLTFVKSQELHEVFPGSIAYGFAMKK